jgi:hypothetical protein
VRPLVFAPYIVDMQPMGSFDASHQELQNGLIRFRIWTCQREKVLKYFFKWPKIVISVVFLSLVRSSRKASCIVL